MRIAFAGGGTGGHVFPIRSLIQYIEKISPVTHEFFWYGEKNSLEESIALQLQKNITHLVFSPITSGKYRRDLSVQSIARNCIDIGRLLWGTITSFRYLKKDRIDVVFCKG
jgi:UDP-N-acetylglucosamine--N-acetylmuramyl-(pentapeptide) pyrophosphoryl-undecaprenol N-acetylglucosamine transferase